MPFPPYLETQKYDEADMGNHHRAFFKCGAFFLSSFSTLQLDGSAKPKIILIVTLYLPDACSRVPVLTAALSESDSIGWAGSTQANEHRDKIWAVDESEYCQKL